MKTLHFKNKILQDLIDLLQARFPNYIKRHGLYKALPDLYSHYRQSLTTRTYINVFTTYGISELSGYQEFLKDIHYITFTQQDDKKFFYCSSTYKGMWTMFLLKEYMQTHKGFNFIPHYGEIKE